MAGRKTRCNHRQPGPSATTIDPQLVMSAFLLVDQWMVVWMVAGVDSGCDGRQTDNGSTSGLTVTNDPEGVTGERGEGHRWCER